MDHHTFVAFAPGRKKDDSQRIVGNSTSQMHDELMVEWRANPESWGCNKCRDPVPLAILGGWSSLVPTRKLYEAGICGGVCALARSSGLPGQSIYGKQ
jgi:hypothetical protein